MQNTLGIEDLGRLYYKTLRDDSNSVVFISTINYLRTTKVVSALNVRWTPLFKLTNRKFPDSTCDMLMSTIKVCQSVVFYSSRSLKFAHLTFSIECTLVMNPPKYVS